MTPIYLYNGKILTKNNAIAVSEDCCCGDIGDCGENNVYIDGPTLTWEWTNFGGFGGWQLVGDFQDAIDQCNEFYNTNNLGGGGPISPDYLVGENFGDRATVPSCLCGS
jgi:hypothetical protein